MTLPSSLSLDVDKARLELHVYADIMSMLKDGDYALCRLKVLINLLTIAGGRTDGGWMGSMGGSGLGRGEGGVLRGGVAAMGTYSVQLI